METTSLLLPPSQRAKLLSAGYTTVHSLCNVSHIDLSRDVGISSEEALEILQIAWNSTGATSSSNTGTLLTGARTAWDLLHQETSRKRIVTFCDELDRILGGGIGPKEVTELDGVPGIGKTQIGIQLAVNVQIPAEFGGLEGQAVYIDTEGSFMVERVCQIAEACVKKLEAFPSRSETRAMKDNRKLHIDDILENIFFFRVCSSTEQIALVNYLDKFIEEHKKVKIVIVDSVTFHFRQDFDDLALRTRLLGVMAQKLMGLAEKYDTAVKHGHIPVPTVLFYIGVAITVLLT
eukprot:TRINITY_DN10572_c0_g1_i1.p1 TRINITY_DN10572_c0_g1~~TRINITY_DN10572_c0_g1_i1.p1  ORF type:complete len:299 (+),score=61.89 TRINITY_DN10572_c0_g1_i1:26-898(+)